MGVAINFALGENGILKSAEYAVDKYQNKAEQENKTLGNYENTIENYINSTREQIMVDKEEYENLKNRLEELENKNVLVYETGEFNQYVAYGSKYAYYTIQLANTYTEEDNAKLIITGITQPNAMYFSANTIAGKVIGNKITITLLNYAGESSYSKTYNVKYAVIKYDNDTVKSEW